ncbi:hypothetical protein SH467x_001682 [Pirellulaceae bacterium SH467]
METSLHRELKKLYAASPDAIEVAESNYRIDAIDAAGALVEIQHAGLGILRRKILSLLEDGHRVRIVKPWIERKTIETYDKKSGELLRKRKSPKSQRPIQFFGELIHFTQVFPHPRLSIEILSVQCIERRIDTPKRGRRKQYKSLDMMLALPPDPHSATPLRTTKDLWKLMGRPKLPKTFDTMELAQAIGEPRWLAQQIAYVLRRCGATEQHSKRGNAIVYHRAA